MYETMMENYGMFMKYALLFIGVHRSHSFESKSLLLNLWGMRRKSRPSYLECNCHVFTKQM